MAQPYTVGTLDDLCLGIDHLAQKLTSSMLSAQEESACVGEVIQIVQRMGEGMAWAYNTHHHAGLGEEFAQPFLDRHIRERLKELLTDTRCMRVESRNQVAAQILQTIHILLQATPSDSVLFCSLTAGWYLNDVVTAPLDFRANEDLLPLWMTVVKDIASMLTRDNLMLFFDADSKKPFPIFGEAVKYYHHPVAQVRTHVQATSLDIFLKLRDEDMWTEPLFQLVLAESSVYFTHVCCLLRDFWKMADEAVRSGAKRDARNAIYIQNDILMYINDVFSCEIPQVTAILQEKLLRFAVLPVLVRSVVRPPEFSSSEFLDKSLTKPPAKDYLTSATAWYFLYDVLCTLRSPQVLATVARVLLRTELPEEVLLLAMAPPPRTPDQYLALQAEWGSASSGSSFACAGPRCPDEDLYATPPVPLVLLVDAQKGSLHKNTLPDVLQTVVLGLAADSSAKSRSPGSAPSDLQGPRAPCSVLAVIALLLRSAAVVRESVGQAVVEKLGGALCNLLDLHRMLEWPVLESGLCALQELYRASNVPIGRAAKLLGSTLNKNLLHGLAVLLIKESTQARGDNLTHLLQEFEEQWAKHKQGLKEPTLASLQRELLERGTDLETIAARPAMHRELTFCRSQCLLLTLYALQIQQHAGAHDSSLPGEFPDGSGSLHGMPGYSADELEEAKMYKPGVSLHIGKMPRVKCQAQTDRRGCEAETMYMISLKTLLVLVRPDDLKPFYAVPVIVEPYRHIRLIDSQQGRMPLEALQGGGDSKRPVTMEISRPSSPFFHPRRNSQGGPSRTPGPPTGSFGHRGAGHETLGLTARAAKFFGRSHTADMDSLSTTVPTLSSLDEDVQTSQLTLFFPEDRRMKIATQVIASGRAFVSQRMSEGIDKFFKGILDEVES
mmetsp:Transcript_61180/g.138297  ORF Transcript_61180/g.138297 Transcript_61180/m.138297 type:complete len:893 (-) Transcript_61180:23-2701(-)